ncbi:acetyltransferase-like isoleucine patch superfamily enzyme [Leptospira meyeri]|uniref:Acetyltransferase-like isoleucine patch superfamily enzyme n=1 Tax=Leptospira meyeri TaxID=29508 RepID=A0A4R8MPM8_LEPME|nr:CatB-related O-acetyltransferase [Leptospira meyeri]TDY71190.1 acetyltransferase-like isoleucine patch superfamily enzyme [Leptospira meyeri]
MIRKIRSYFIHRIIKILNRLLNDRFEQISNRYHLVCEGTFYSSNGCSIGVGSNLIIPNGTELLLGEGVYIGRNVEIGPGNRIEIGDYTSIQDRTTILGDVSIGRYCTFAANISISSGNHYFDKFPELNIKDQDRRVLKDPELRNQHSKPVVIEDDCWLGANVFVMNGLKIGKGCVIGANAVITKDVLPYSVVAGVPGKKIRNRINFIPPTSLDYNRSIDLPYFYSGFLVSDAERERYHELNGLGTKKQFSIALKHDSGDVVVVRCKKIVSEKVWLRYNDSKQELSDEFTDLSFRLDSEESIIHFSLAIDPNQNLDKSLSLIVVGSCSIKKQ